MTQKRNKKEVNITVKAFIHIGSEIVDMDTLNNQQRSYIGKMLNYLGVKNVMAAKGYEAIPPKLPPKEEVFAEFFKKDKE